jgi:hypothetical protein
MLNLETAQRRALDSEHCGCSMCVKASVALQLTAQQAAVEELRPYLKHAKYCGAEQGDGWGCSCGLTKLLASVGAKEEAK